MVWSIVFPVASGKVFLYVGKRKYVSEKDEREAGSDGVGCRQSLCALLRLKSRDD